MSLIFHTNPISRGCIVRRMLEETGAPYETRLIKPVIPAKAGCQ